VNSSEIYKMKKHSQRRFQKNLEDGIRVKVGNRKIELWIIVDPESEEVSPGNTQNLIF
jgi:hypothetical protein